MNSLFALFELFLTRTSPPPWLHLPVLILILALYLGLAYLTYRTEGFYVYSFLNPSLHGRGRVVAYVFGILAAVIVIFSLVKLLIWLRKRVTERDFHLEGKLHAGRSKQHGDIEMSHTFN